MHRNRDPVDVVVIIGQAGVGKTRACYNADEYLYQVTDFKWWDGYVSQETILIDDFYGSRCSYSTLLRLLDRYQYSLPIKNSFTWKRWKTVLITSNVHPEQWYTKGFTPALQRRIDLILNV